MSSLYASHEFYSEEPNAARRKSVDTIIRLGARNLNAAGGCWTIDPRALQAYQRYFELVESFGAFHPWVPHGGQLSAVAVASRTSVAADDLIARSSGTDALERLWMLIRDWFRSLDATRGRSHQIRLITSDEEYPSASDLFHRHIAAEFSGRFHVQVLDTTALRTGIEPERLDRQLLYWTESLSDDDVGVAFFSHVQYRTGLVVPLRRFARILGSSGHPRLVIAADCAQSFGHVPLSFQDLGCDLAVLCLHKWISGPKVGYLYTRAGTDFARLAASMGQIDISRDLRHRDGVPIGGTAATQSRETFLVASHAVDLYWEQLGMQRIRHLAELFDDALRSHPSLVMVSPRLGTAAAGAMIAFRLKSANDSNTYYDLQSELLVSHRVQCAVVGEKPAFEEAGGEKYTIRISPDWRLSEADVEAAITGIRAALVGVPAVH